VVVAAILEEEEEIATLFGRQQGMLFDLGCWTLKKSRKSLKS
jgi:hypothetical protein